ncbi:hypothetical protein BVRB_2g044070 [Beta vulgaris subsp. vulgaris]|nr:hypothetical protein BVRB_2g044070 [Beta vulgaris subsp. vulgaris]
MGLRFLYGLLFLSISCVAFTFLYFALHPVFYLTS